MSLNRITPAALVVNTKSRRGEELYPRAKELLRAKGIELSAGYPVRDAARMTEVVRETIAEGHRLVIVGGGDGTISSVVDEFAHQDVVLGVLPLGTANNFARSAGLPLDLAEADEVIAGGRVLKVNLGRVNENHFTNMASLGLSPAIGRAVPSAMKRYLGRTGYLLVGVRTFFSFKPFRVRVIRDGSAVEMLALEVLVANGRYHGGVIVAQQASLTGSDLVVRITRGETKWNLLRAWAKAELGSTEQPPGVEILLATEIEIDASPRQDVSIDGEVITRTPIKASLAREALNLLVPYDREEAALLPRPIPAAN